MRLRGWNQEYPGDVAYLGRPSPGSIPGYELAGWPNPADWVVVRQGPVGCLDASDRKMGACSASCADSMNLTSSRIRGGRLTGARALTS